MADSYIMYVLSVSNLQSVAGENSLQLTWTTYTLECPCSVIYLVEYSLTNPGQCGIIDNATRMTGGTTSDQIFTINGLSPYCSYNVYITPMVNNRRGDETTMSAMTSESSK